MASPPVLGPAKRLPSAEPGAIRSPLEPGRPFEPFVPDEPPPEVVAPDLVNKYVDNIEADVETFREPAKYAHSPEEQQRMFSSFVMGAALGLEDDEAYDQVDALNEEAKTNPSLFGLLSDMTKTVSEGWGRGKLGLEEAFLLEAAFNIPGADTPENKERREAINTELEQMRTVPEADRGLFRKIRDYVLITISENVPLLLESARRGAELGGESGILVGAAGSVTLGPEVGIPIGLSAAAVGGVYGGFETIRKAETGFMIKELQSVASEEGIQLSDDMIRNLSNVVGNLNGALELIGIGALVKGVPGGKALLRKIQREAIRDAVRGRSFRGFLKRFAGRFAGLAAFESGIEATQEFTNIVFRRFGEGYLREFGLFVPETELKQELSRLGEAGLAGAVFSILGLPTITVRTISETRQGRGIARQLQAAGVDPTEFGRRDLTVEEVKATIEQIDADREAGILEEAEAAELEDTVEAVADIEALPEVTAPPVRAGDFQARIVGVLEAFTPSETATGLPTTKAFLAQELDTTPDEIEAMAANIIKEGQPTTDAERALLQTVTANLDNPDIDIADAIAPEPEIDVEEINALIDSGATEDEIVAQILGAEPVITPEEVVSEGDIPIVDTAEAEAALTELQVAQQEAAAEARAAQLEQRAAEIEADAIATLRALEEGADPLPQLERLGNIVFDEGATDIETFTARMKTKLGDLWERFKEFIQTIFDKLKEERGAIEFGRDVPLFPELQFDSDLKPVFDADNRLASLEAFIEEGGRQQVAIKELKDRNKTDIIRVINKIQNNQALNNEAEKTIALEIAEALGAAFFVQVQATRGDFLDATEALAEGELNTITDAGIADFIASITFVKVEKPTKVQVQAAQIKEQGETIANLEKELTRIKGVAQERSAEIFRQQERLEETTDILVAEIKEQVRLATVARREGRQEAVDKATERINALRGRIGRERKKVTIERLTRRTVTQFIKDKLPLSQQGKFLKAIANAQTPKQFGQIIERAQAFADAFAESDRKKQLRGQIKKELKTTKVKKKAGKPVGKFTPEVQKTLDMLREAAKLDREEAGAKITANLAQFSDTIPPDDVALENRVLSMIHGFDNRTSDELATLLQEVKDIKDEGRMIAELRKFNRQAKIERAVGEGIDVVSGGKGLPASISAGERAAALELDKIQGITDRAKRWFSTTGLSLVGWKDLLDIMSRLDKTSKPFESELSKLGDVLTTKNAEKQGIRINIERIKQLYRDSFGLKSARDVMKRINEDSKRIDLGEFTDLNGNKIQLEFTKAEARKRFMEFADPTLDQTFTEGMGYTEDMKSAIVGLLTPEDKAFAQSQLDFYGKYYEGINNSYRDIYGVDLPRNPNYNPIRREGVTREEVMGFGEFLQEVNIRASVTSGSLKARVKNIRPISQQGDLAVLEQHMTEMEHFKAWAPRMRDLQALFGNSDFRTAVKLFHGNNILGVIDNFMADFTRGGVDRAGRLNWMDKLRSNLARSVLSVKASIGIKQLTSFIAYADAIPVTEFVKGTVDFWSRPVENVKFMWQHSELIKDRWTRQSMERDIKAARESDEHAAWRASPGFLNTLMLNVRLGDIGAIAMGGWPVIKHHMNQGKSIEEAVRIFEQVTESTQQSADLSELSTIQRGGSFAKLFTIFLSSPNQYLRKEVAGLRNLFAGRASVAQAAKTITIFHLLLPMLFQWASDAFTWDEDEQLRAIILGPLNGIFVIGDILDGMIRNALGLRVFDDEVPVYSIKDDAIKAWELLSPGDLDTEETLRAIRGIAGLVGAKTGLPAKQLVDLVAAVEEILTGDFEKGAAQLLGWTPFTAEKRTDKKGSAF